MSDTRSDGFNVQLQRAQVAEALNVQLLRAQAFIRDRFRTSAFVELLLDSDGMPTWDSVSLCYTRASDWGLYIERQGAGVFTSLFVAPLRERVAAAAAMPELLKQLREQDTLGRQEIEQATLDLARFLDSEGAA